MELDNKKYVVDHLLSTKREGMEDLVAYMDEIGFFTAPASGGNHECCEFGLVQHTRNVMMNAENIGYALLGKEGYEKIRNSVIISSGRASPNMVCRLVRFVSQELRFRYCCRDAS